MSSEKIITDLTKIWYDLTKAMVKNPKTAEQFNDARQKVDDVIDNIIFNTK